jgi:hypothetical protein
MGSRRFGFFADCSAGDIWAPWHNTDFGTLAGKPAETTTLFSRRAGLHEKAGCCASANCLPRTIPASSRSPPTSGLAIGLKRCEFPNCHVGPGLSDHSMDCIMLSILSDTCPSLKCGPLLRELTTCGGFRRSLSSPPSWSNGVSRCPLAPATLPLPIVEWIDLEAGCVSSAFQGCILIRTCCRHLLFLIHSIQSSHSLNNKSNSFATVA